MTKISQYHSKQLDENGVIEWSEREHQTWNQLLTRQSATIDHACQQYQDGLAYLALSNTHIPDLSSLSNQLYQASGWQVEPVPALINFDRFFQLLANRQFPVATFIRHPEDLDYLQEPDIFHEIYGHCPMLTDPAFAEFTHTYGKIGVSASHQQRVYLARLYWFTVEFGLIRNHEQLQIYGGGILSSPKETQHALKLDDYQTKVTHVPFNIQDVLRTPYRIDKLQTQYFYLQSIEDLFEISQLPLLQLVDEAIATGVKTATEGNNL